MKLLPTILAVASANDLAEGVHDQNCLFPNADYPAVFADPFSQFSFSDAAVASESYGDLYQEGTTLYRQCPVEGSCAVNADESVSCDFSGSVIEYPCQFYEPRSMYAFMDLGQKSTNEEQAAKGRIRTIFFRGGRWTKYKPANRDIVLCPGYGKKKIVPASAEAAPALCGAKPIVPNSKQEWADEDDKSVPSTPQECTIWNADGTSTSCAVGCMKKAPKKDQNKPEKTLNLVCAQRKYGNGSFKWWSIEDGKFRPAGKRLLKAVYWCVPDPDYVPESSGEGSGEGSGAQEIENADVSM